MLTDRAPTFADATRRHGGIPYGSQAGIQYHIALQFDQQGAHDLAASHYRAAAEEAENGDLRDYCLLRFRQLTIGETSQLEPCLN